ncbi:MAG TPA: cache domain-containing protein [Gaiellaceae bacterium]|jgi:hypothetical protein
MDVLEEPVEPQEAPRWEPWWTRRWPYVLAGLAVAILAVFWAGQRATQGVRHELDARLRAAGAGADAALVDVEAEQLSALRAISFTDGVGRALAEHDVKTLNRLVAPIQANAGVPMVDIVLPDGRVALAVRSKGAPAPAASRAGMFAITTALARAHNSRSGRFSEIVILKSGPTLLTIGPLLSGSVPIGAALVMTPLADVLGRLAQEVGTTLTAYDTRGDPIATTAGWDPRPVDSDTAQSLTAGGAIVMRYVHGSQREALGRLIVDHQAASLLGVSLHDDSAATGRAVTLYAALGLIGTILIVVSFSLRLANRWWRS